MKLSTVPGGVQWMCAGKGIIHAEMPVHATGSPDPRGFQLWVDLPKKVRPSLYGRNQCTDYMEPQFKMVVRRSNLPGSILMPNSSQDPSYQELSPDQ